MTTRSSAPLEPRVGRADVTFACSASIANSPVASCRSPGRRPQPCSSPRSKRGRMGRSEICSGEFRRCTSANDGELPRQLSRRLLRRTAAYPSSVGAVEASAQIFPGDCFHQPGAVVGHSALDLCRPGLFDLGARGLCLLEVLQQQTRELRPFVRLELRCSFVQLSDRSVRGDYSTRPRLPGCAAWSVRRRQ